MEKVLRAVDLIPPGRVASYGDIAGIVGRGPRFVGSVLSRFGDGCPWWRVPNAAGKFPPDLLDRARPFWLEEGISFSGDGRGCRIAEHRADLELLSARWRKAVADLE